MTASSPYRAALLPRRAPRAAWWRVAWALWRLRRALRARAERRRLAEARACWDAGFLVPSLNLAIDLANAAIAKAEAILNGNEDRAREAEAEEDAARARLVDAAMPKRP